MANSTGAQTGRVEFNRGSLNPWADTEARHAGNGCSRFWKMLTGTLKRNPVVVYVPVLAFCIVLGLGLFGIFFGIEQKLHENSTHAQYAAEAAMPILELSVLKARNMMRATVTAIKMFPMTFAFMDASNSSILSNLWAKDDYTNAEVSASFVRVIIAPLGYVGVRYPLDAPGLIWTTGQDLLASDSPYLAGALQALETTRPVLQGSLLGGGSNSLAVEFESISLDPGAVTAALQGSPYSRRSGSPGRASATAGLNTSTWWGFVIMEVDLAKLAKALAQSAVELEDDGYRLRVLYAQPFGNQSAHELLIYQTTDSAPTKGAATAVKTFPAGTFTLVLWQDDWYPPYVAPLIVMVVLVSVGVWAFTFLLLIKWKQNRALLSHVLPKATISRLRAKWDWKAIDAGRSAVEKSEHQSGTPADMILKVVNACLSGQKPPTHRLVSIREALLSSVDVYKLPATDLGRQMMEANVDDEVKRALMAQLTGAAPARQQTFSNLGGTSCYPDERGEYAYRIGARSESEHGHCQEGELDMDEDVARNHSLLSSRYSQISQQGANVTLDSTDKDMSVEGNAPGPRDGIGHADAGMEDETASKFVHPGGAGPFAMVYRGSMNGLPSLVDFGSLAAAAVLEEPGQERQSRSTLADTSDGRTSTVSFGAGMANGPGAGRGARRSRAVARGMHATTSFGRVSGGSHCGGAFVRSSNPVLHANPAYTPGGLSGHASAGVHARMPSAIRGQSSNRGGASDGQQGPRSGGACAREIGVRFASSTGVSRNLGLAGVFAHLMQFPEAEELPPADHVSFNQVLASRASSNSNTVPVHIPAVSTLARPLGLDDPNLSSGGSSPPSATCKMGGGGVSMNGLRQPVFPERLTLPPNRCTGGAGKVCSSEPEVLGENSCTCDAALADAKPKAEPVGDSPGSLTLALPTLSRLCAPITISTFVARDNSADLYPPSPTTPVLLVGPTTGGVTHTHTRSSSAKPTGTLSTVDSISITLDPIFTTGSPKQRANSTATSINPPCTAATTAHVQSRANSMSQRTAALRTRPSQAGALGSILTARFSSKSYVDLTYKNSITSSEAARGWGSPTSSQQGTKRWISSVPAEHPCRPIFTQLDTVLVTCDSWTFDAYALEEATSGHPLSVLGYWLFHSTGLIKWADLNRQRLVRFLQHLEDGYAQTNPYHNRRHAADVLQTLHVLLHSGGLMPGYADRHTLLACYLAAIVHDYEHKGRSNDFLINAHDDLAVRYNDRSPMENHHLAAAFGLLKQNEFNFLQCMPRPAWEALRKLVIELVLATDMKQHFSILGQFSSLHHGNHTPHTEGADTGSSARSSGTSASVPPVRPPSSEIQRLVSTPSIDILAPLTDHDKMLSLQMALKCADLGHLAAPLKVHLRWVSALEAEFFLQGDAERAMGLSVSPLCDRNKEGVTKSQVGFFDFVVCPLFRAFTTRFTAARPLLHAVLSNYAYWQGMARHTFARGSDALSGTSIDMKPASELRKTQEAATVQPEAWNSGVSATHTDGQADGTAMASPTRKCGERRLNSDMGSGNFSGGLTGLGQPASQASIASSSIAPTSSGVGGSKGKFPLLSPGGIALKLRGRSTISAKSLPVSGMAGPDAAAGKRQMSVAKM